MGGGEIWLEFENTFTLMNFGLNGWVNNKWLDGGS
jgi:hypothetical protein